MIMKFKNKCSRSSRNFSIPFIIFIFLKFEMYSLFTLLRLIKEFCELVPEDYEYSNDSPCLYSVIRNYLIQAIDTYSESSPERDVNLLQEFKCTGKIYALMEEFTNASIGKDFKKLLTKYL